jgi:hypothetical protein
LNNTEGNFNTSIGEFALSHNTSRQQQHGQRVSSAVFQHNW